MITEDYVSYEVAKLLKEKGFDEICSYEWGVPDIDRGYILQKWSIYNGEIKNSELIDDAYAAPTHQMACKWLREVHNIFIAINVSWPEGDMRNPMSWRCEIIDTKTTKRDHSNFIYRPTYEEAVEAAIKYVLKNLI